LKKKEEVKPLLSERQKKVFYKLIVEMGGIHCFAEKYGFNYEYVLLTLSGNRKDTNIIRRIRKLARWVRE
jgi:hypothetical protein